MADSRGPYSSYPWIIASGCSAVTVITPQLVSDLSRLVATPFY